MENLLITGANGFVGKRLLNLLNDRYNIIATGRQPADGILQMDITSMQDVIQVIQQTSPAIIVHCAAMSKPDECELNRDLALIVNTNSVEYLLEAAAKHKSYFVFLSTDFVFDGEKGMYTEEDLPSPVNFYGETKRRAEKLVQQYPYGWCIIRTVLVYGSCEGTRDNIVTSAAKALEKKQSLKIVNDQVRTPTHVDDLCKAIASAIEKKAQGIFHISGKDVMTPYEMVIATARFLRLDESLVKPVTQDSFSQPAKRPLKTGFNISKAAGELSFEPVSFMQGLSKTFKTPT